MAAYITYQDVRDITSGDLTTDDISNDDLTNSIIPYAISELNNAICTKVTEERVVNIDTYRENAINGSNVTFFVQSSFGWYLGDFNDDGEIDENDAKVWLYNPSDKSRTAAVISAIDEIGKITLSTAPSNSINRINITYRRSPVSISDPLLKKACAELAASIAYGGIDAREKKRVSIRGFSISRNPEAESKYHNRYIRTLVQLNSRQTVVEKKQVESLKPLIYIKDMGEVSPYERY